MISVTALVAIAAATLASEDLTAIGAGLAVRAGTLPAVWAVLACAMGIFVGDVALWAAGRYGVRRLLDAAGLSSRIDFSRTAPGRWFLQHPALAILGSRFVPGSRVPLYVAAGATRQHTAKVLLWMAVAVSIWTPLLVGAAALLGGALTTRIETLAGGRWLAQLTTLSLGFVIVRGFGSTAARGKGGAFSVRVARLRAWEFWPAWVLNLPVAAWIAGLAVRHRSLVVFTAANPGIPGGGVVGESKARILAALPQEWVMPWGVVEPGDLPARLESLTQLVSVRGWHFPLVFKPDVGERGRGVRWIRDERQAEAYLTDVRTRVIVQVPHEGPFEAGLFYVRHPEERRGRVISVTYKRFPVVLGDGASTLERLILTHPRYRLQARVFLKRHATELHRVPAFGERVSLGRAGNHCQGTEFLDGSGLLTPALAARIDEIAQRFDGFYFGRFDVRYRNRDAFMAGDDLAIVEVNGVTSEATHIYDPAGSIWKAWRVLMRQWSLAFAIGAANRARGHRPVALRSLGAAVWTFLRTSPALSISD